MLSKIEIVSRLSCAYYSILSWIAPISAVVFAQGGYSAPVSGIAMITVLPKKRGVLARIGTFIFRNKPVATPHDTTGFDIARFDIDVFDDI